MQSGTIAVVKNSEGTSVKNKIWGRFHYILGIYLSLVIVYLPAYSFVPPIWYLFIFYFYGS